MNYAVGDMEALLLSRLIVEYIKGNILLADDGLRFIVGASDVSKALTINKVAMERNRIMTVFIEDFKLNREQYLRHIAQVELQAILFKYEQISVPKLPEAVYNLLSVTSVSTDHQTLMTETCDIEFDTLMTKVHLAMENYGYKEMLEFMELFSFSYKSNPIAWLRISDYEQQLSLKAL